MLELRFLSQPRVTLDGEAVNDFVSDKALALLCFLAMNEGSHARRRLAGLLWGEMPAKRARANLRVALHNLNKTVPGYLDVTRKRVRFVRAQPHWFDVTEFEEAAENTSDPEALAEAVNLYEDEFLRELRVKGAPALQAWLRSEQERMRLCLIDLLERLSAHYCAEDRWHEATTVMRRLLRIEPWREETHRRLMLLLARQGNYGAALAQYEQCRAVLDTDLGVRPMPATERLVERIRQIRAHPRGNLPPTATPLVGRKPLLKDLSRRLSEEACRLLTLHGPGGIGKTRLALALAERVQERFLDGVYYVSLSDVGASRHVPMAIAEAMGISLGGPRPAIEQLLRHLEQREALLVLDNCEQLPEVAALIPRLFAASSALKVVAASRVTLNLPEEWTFEVAGLTVPDASAPDKRNAEAVQLFLQRAKQTRPDFAPEGPELMAVMQLCRLVEGIPLAIEQAASWLRVLSCHQLVRELDRSLFFLIHATPASKGRHKNMDAVLEQSWRLLREEEQQAFASLSVFRGGFTRKAAVYVTGVPTPTLAVLVEHSLLRFDHVNERYQMHELVRQFGVRKLYLRERVEKDVRGRHASYFADFVKAQNSAAFSTNEARALRRFQMDIDNVRAAWRLVLDWQEPELLETFLQGFWYFHELQGLYREGLELFANAVERLNTERNRRSVSLAKARGLALAYLGWFRLRTGAYKPALASLEEGVALLRSRDDTPVPGWPLFCLGFAAQLMGDYPRAEALIEESAALHHAHGNDSGSFHSESALAFLWLSSGKPAAAEAQIEKVAAEWAEKGGRRMLSNTYNIRGLSALALGKHERAEGFLREGLAVSREGGDEWNEALGIHYLGLVSRAEGDFLDARKQHQEALSLMEALGEKLGIAFCLLGLGWAEHALQNVAASRAHFDRALAVGWEIHVPPQVLEAITGIAACLLVAGKRARAGRLLALVSAHPATARPVRQQAELLLRRSSAGAAPRKRDRSEMALAPLVSELLGTVQPRAPQRTVTSQAVTMAT